MPFLFLGLMSSTEFPICRSHVYAKLDGGCDVISGWLVFELQHYSRFSFAVFLTNIQQTDIRLTFFIMLLLSVGLAS